MTVYKFQSSKNATSFLYASQNTNEGVLHITRDAHFDTYLSKRKEVPFKVIICDTVKDVEQMLLSFNFVMRS